MTGERNRGNNRGCTFSVLPQDRDFATRCHLQNISADNWNEDYFYLIKKECNKWDSAGVDPLDWASMFCQLLPNKNSWSFTGKKSEPRAQKTGAMQLRKKENIGHGKLSIRIRGGNGMAIRSLACCFISACRRRSVQCFSFRAGTDTRREEWSVQLQSRDFGCCLVGGYFHEWWKEEAVKELAANTTASMRAVLPHKTNRRLRLFHFFPLFFLGPRRLLLRLILLLRLLVTASPKLL